MNEIQNETMSQTMNEEKKTNRLGTASLVCGIVAASVLVIALLGTVACMTMLIFAAFAVDNTLAEGGVSVLEIFLAIGLSGLLPGLAGIGLGIAGTVNASRHRIGMVRSVIGLCLSAVGSLLLILWMLGNLQ